MRSYQSTGFSFSGSGGGGNGGTTTLNAGQVSTLLAMFEEHASAPASDDEFIILDASDERTAKRVPISQLPSGSGTGSGTASLVRYVAANNVTVFNNVYTFSSLSDADDLVGGRTVVFRAEGASTAPVSIRLGSSTGTSPLRQYNNQSVSTGDLVDGQLVIATYISGSSIWLANLGHVPLPWARFGNTSTIPDNKIPASIARDTEIRTAFVASSVSSQSDSTGTIYTLSFPAGERPTAINSHGNVYFFNANAANTGVVRLQVQLADGTTSGNFPMVSVENQSLIAGDIQPGQMVRATFSNGRLYSDIRRTFVPHVHDTEDHGALFIGAADVTQSGNLLELDLGDDVTLAHGLTLRFFVKTANTGEVNVRVTTSTTNTYNLLRADRSELEANDMRVGQPVVLTFDDSGVPDVWVTNITAAGTTTAGSPGPAGPAGDQNVYVANNVSSTVSSVNTTYDLRFPTGSAPAAVQAGDVIYFRPNANNGGGVTARIHLAGGTNVAHSVRDAGGGVILSNDFVAGRLYRLVNVDGTLLYADTGVPVTTHTHPAEAEHGAIFVLPTNVSHTQDASDVIIGITLTVAGLTPDAGTTLRFFSEIENPGALDLRIGTGTFRNLLRADRSELQAGDLAVGQPVTVVYDDTGTEPVWVTNIVASVSTGGGTGDNVISSTQRLFYVRSVNRPTGFPEVITASASDFTGTPPVYNVEQPVLGGVTFYRDYNSVPAGAGRIWAVHVGTLDYSGTTANRVFASFPAPYVIEAGAETTTEVLYYFRATDDIDSSEITGFSVTGTPPSITDETLDIGGTTVYRDLDMVPSNRDLLRAVTVTVNSYTTGDDRAFSSRSFPYADPESIPGSIVNSSHGAPTADPEFQNRLAVDDHGLVHSSIFEYVGGTTTGDFSAVSLSRQSLIMVGTSTDRVYTLNEDGSWDEGIDLPDGENVPRAVAHDPTTGDLLIIGNSRDRLYRRHDGVWDAGLSLTGIENSAHGLAIDPANGDILIVGSGLRVRRYNGSTWDAGLTLPTNEFNPRGLAIDPANGDILLIGISLRRVFRHNGTAWDDGTAQLPVEETSPAGLAYNPLTMQFWVAGDGTNSFWVYNGSGWDRQDLALPAGEVTPAGATFRSFEAYAGEHADDAAAILAASEITGIASEYFYFNSTEFRLRQLVDSRFRDRQLDAMIAGAMFNGIFATDDGALRAANVDSSGNTYVYIRTGENAGLRRITNWSRTGGGGRWVWQIFRDPWALRVDSRNTLTETQQSNLQVDLGGPFARATSETQQGEQQAAPVARWAGEDRILFLAGSQFSPVVAQEVPASGARLLPNVLHGGPFPFPGVTSDGRLRTGVGAFSMQFDTIPDRFCLALKFQSVQLSNPTANQLIVHGDGFFVYRNAGNVTLGWGNARMQLGAHNPANAATIVFYAEKSGTNWSLRADSSFGPHLVTTESTSPASGLFGFGSPAPGIAPPASHVFYDGFIWDIVAFSPQVALDEAAVSAMLAEASRSNLYGRFERRTVDYQNTSLPHGGSFTAASGAINVAANARAGEVHEISLLNAGGIRAHRVQVLPSDLNVGIQPTDLGLEYLIGSTSYHRGEANVDESPVTFSRAHFDGDNLRLRVRNLAATALTSYRIDAQAYDPRTDDEIEIFEAIPSAVAGFTGAVYAFAGGRSIHRDEIAWIFVHGMPGHGSTNAWLYNPGAMLDCLVVGATGDPRPGDFFVGGWSVNDQQSAFVLFENAARPASIPYITGSFRRASNEPANTCSRIEITENEVSNRNIHKVVMGLYT